MNDIPQFIDYYQILQVSPGCDEKILESAYHTLAKLFHPDRPGTADAGKFSDIVEAYKVLRDPDRRAEYDQQYAQIFGEPAMRGPVEANGGDVGAAIGDAEDHAVILIQLYKHRRENAQSAGVLAFRLQEMLGCTEEHFAFHQWYLKEKGFIALTEQGELAITVLGVDHVISMSRTTKAKKLRLERQRD